jgi:transcriptional regulator with XRE-family HTH domain
MSSFGNNLKQIRESRGLSQQSFADEVNAIMGLDLKRTAISNYEKGTSRPDLDKLTAFAKILDVSADALLGLVPIEGGKVKGKVRGKVRGKVETDYQFKNNTKNLTLQEPPNPYKTIQPVVVTVDSSFNQNITFVPIRAHAGYLNAFHDSEYIKELPVFAIPGFQNATFRAFEIAGYSMLPYQGAGLYPSDIVVAQYLESPFEMRDGRVYVIVSRDQGIIIKRCLNRISENNKVIAQSDNTNGEYPAIVLDLEEIQEVWEFKAKISRQIPRPGNIFSRLDDIEAKLALINDVKG